MQGKYFAVVTLFYSDQECKTTFLISDSNIKYFPLVGKNRFLFGSVSFSIVFAKILHVLFGLAGIEFVLSRKAVLDIIY